MSVFKENSLLLYKQRPARLVRIGDRLELELERGETARVRVKDVSVLHPGPIKSLSELRPQDGELHTAWELMAGEQTTLPTLAELIYGAYTPATAWAAWQQVADGLYFEGTPDSIHAHTPEEVARRKHEREQAETHQRVWGAFIQRTKRGEYQPADREFFRDVETLALGRSERSNLMRELNRADTPDTAHAMLLDLGVWDAQVNPYPARFGLALNQVDLPVPDLPEEPRRDLTHLPAYAIDDEGTDTPDDALSLDGDRLWVHVADVAALVTPDSPLDLEARARGMSLHLPEGTIHLLPRAVTDRLGLGLNETSPALSFGLDIDDSGVVTGLEIVPSRVRVTRLTYAGAEERMDEEPFRTLALRAEAARQRRRANGAVMIDFPEARITVEDGQVDIRPLPPLRSRALVEEAMIQACAATAKFAVENGIRLAFSQQEPAETTERPQTLSGMFALRRLLKRSRLSTIPAPHSGLGVPAYAQVTSPLRRYLDLVSHQQIRAFLKGQPQLDEAQLLERIGAYEAVIGDLRQAEMLSEKHWTLVYLLQHPGWHGEGILIDKRGSTGLIIIPDLALEIRAHLTRDLPLDARIPVVLKSVNLPERDVSFRVGA